MEINICKENKIGEDNLWNKKNVSVARTNFASVKKEYKRDAIAAIVAVKNRKKRKMTKEKKLADLHDQLTNVLKDITKNTGE